MSIFSLRVLGIVFLFSHAVVSQPITNGLIGYWPFNGNTTDESGNLHHIINSGATVANDRFGRAGRAYQFDGTDDEMELNLDITQYSEFTISLWFNPTVLNRNYQYFIDKSPGATGFGFRLLYDGIDFFSYNASGSPTLTNKSALFATGNWYHVVAVHRLDSNFIYLDGALIVSGPSAHPIAATNQITKIGNSSDSQYANDKFSGIIDDLSLYQRALSTQEVQLIFNETLPVAELCSSIYCDGENVGIGTENTYGHKLAVSGKILSEGVLVKLKANWPDYVFEPDYPLRTLRETKKYIIENRHLPEIPPAQEIEARGVEVGEMNIILLKKIEELTLYQIELLERLEKAEREIATLKVNNK